MRDAVQAAEVLQQAATLNLEDALREGSLLTFPDYGQLVMTGDLHGHRRNFEKLQRYCDLEHFGARQVVLHEIIHRESESASEPDNSWEVLLDAAQWKCDFPDQVHFLQSNHELAQLTRHEITKNGRVVTVDFEEGVRGGFGRGASQVIEAIDQYVRSLPLAGRTANRVFLSHSLPGQRDLPSFDPTVLHRRPTETDLRDGGSAHFLVWGRYQSEQVLAALCEMLDVDFFICGHQPQETGYEIIHDRMVILASDHNHGVLLAMDLGKPVSVASLTRGIRPLAAIA